MNLQTWLEKRNDAVSRELLHRLVSPGSILTQATLALAGSGNAATKARMIAHVTGPLVELGD